MKSKPCDERAKVLLVLSLAVTVMTVLGSATPSHAEIVYKDVYVDIVNQGTYNIDFDDDGVTDFTLALDLTQQTAGYTSKAVDKPARGNGAAGTPLRALKNGARIGPNQQFDEKPQRMASLAVTFAGTEQLGYSGPWPESTTRYLGVSFLIDGETHYGWVSVEFEVLCCEFGPGKLIAKLTGYAYETVAGTPINAGQTH
jgi:hypothetical protein